MRHALLRLVSLLLAAAFPAAASAQEADAQYRITPPAKWVDAQEYDINALPEDGKPHAVYFLLDDTQTNLTVPEMAIYTHKAYKVLSAKGVREHSKASITYDPLYTEVDLHSLSILRDGKVQNRLEPDKIRVLQQEKRLDEDMYNGKNTLLILLEDVRIGDVVDFSYTTRGNNPVLPQLAATFRTQSSRPFECLHRRYITSPERLLHIRTARGAPQPTEKQSEAGQEYVWDLNKIPALELEETQIPGWYYAYPYAQVAEYESWKDFVGVSLPRVENTIVAGPQTVAIAQSIDKAYDSKEEKLLTALRYVEDEIRYVALTMGEKGLTPTEPEKTLNLRYGDCKAKTVLLVALLRNMGIEAHAAIVDSGGMRNLGEKLPSSGFFNHMIVHAVLDGKTYWLDPTRTQQGGDLAHLSQPDFGEALVIAPGTTEPVTMNSGGPAASTAFEDAYDYSAGFDKPALYRATWTAQGSEADRQRRSLNEKGETKYFKDVTKLLEKRYPGIRNRKATYEDDAANNRFTIIMEHELPSPMSMKKDELEFPYHNRGDLKRLPGEKRTMPIAVKFPSNEEHVIELKLPADFDMESMENERQTVQTPYFTGEYSREAHGQTMRHKARFQTHADHAPAEAFADYNGKLEAWSELTRPVRIAVGTQGVKAQSMTVPLALALLVGWIAGLATAFLGWRCRALRAGGVSHG